MADYSNQENFAGNSKHLKVLLQAISASSMAVWNDFVTAQGPQFRADLTGILLPLANLKGANFRRCILTSAVLDGADLTAAVLNGAEMTGTSLVGTKLPETFLRRVRVVAKKAEVPLEEMSEAERRQRRVRDSQQAAQAMLDEKKQFEDRQKKLRKADQEKGRAFFIQDDD